MTVETSLCKNSVDESAYIKSIGIEFNRRLQEYKDHRMTLIIGAVCNEGVVLVGDTKIVDTSKNTVSYTNKILLPLSDKLVAVGASGLTDVFKRFNRRIPIVFDRREKEIRIENEVQLKKVGLSIADFDSPQTQTTQATETIKQEPNPSAPKKSHITPPYIYTGENFLSDCKRVVREITEEEREFHPNPIDVLLSFNAGGVSSLYQINAYGFESEVDSYTAIGSGSVYVDMFFQKLWKERTYAKTIPLACFVIKFVENMQLDNFVGVQEGEIPQVVVVPHTDTDRYGDLGFSNREEFLHRAQKWTDEIGKIIEKIDLPKLNLAEGYTLDSY